MKRIAFKMQLFHGCEAEYKRRHEAIWPELLQLLKQSGIQDYSIFLDKNTNSLFAVLKTTNEMSMEQLPNEPVMQRWWEYMKDIMETNPDHSPVSIPLQEVFYLP
jgi:L-rhamnose mutarotase